MNWTAFFGVLLGLPLAVLFTMGCAISIEERPRTTLMVGLLVVAVIVGVITK